MTKLKKLNKIQNFHRIRVEKELKDYYSVLHDQDYSTQY